MNKKWKVGKAPAKKRSKPSFWTAIFFCPVELPELTIHEFTLQDREQIAVYAKKATAEKAARLRLKDLNEVMLHPEDRKWRYKLVELKGGKK